MKKSVCAFSLVYFSLKKDHPRRLQNFLSIRVKGAFQRPAFLFVALIFLKFEHSHLGSEKSLIYIIRSLGNFDA